MTLQASPISEPCQSLIDRIYSSISDGIHFASPISSLKTNELNLVCEVLRLLQGFSGSILYWDEQGQRFCVKNGIYVPHLSHSSLHELLNQFLYSATCLKLVENVVIRVENYVSSPSPTLRAFASSITAWLQRLRDIALKEEMKIHDSSVGTTPTLLGLASSLSSLCAGAEYLFQIVNGAIPQICLKSNSCIPAAELAVHILDYLYRKLDEACLVQGGEEEAYKMLVHMFVGSLLPYMEGLDSWLFEGTLDDPFEEMFFYKNKSISIDDAEFWEKSYLLRLEQFQKINAEFAAASSARVLASMTKDRKETTEKDSIKVKEQRSKELLACPLFIKDMAKSIVSAGKSLQLIRHLPGTSSLASKRNSDGGNDGFGNPAIRRDLCMMNHRQSMGGLTLSEIFFVSLAGLLGHGDHISRYFCQDDQCSPETITLSCNIGGHSGEKENIDTLPVSPYSETIWYKFLVETLSKKKVTGLHPVRSHLCNFPEIGEANAVGGLENASLHKRSFCPENPIITVCQGTLDKNTTAWKELSLSRMSSLPPLDDEPLRKAVFGEKGELVNGIKGTNYTFGFQFGESEYLRAQDEMRMLEVLFPLPTLLPSFQDELRLPEVLPFQNNSTLSSKVIDWIQRVEPRITPLPMVIMQECLTVYIKKQVDYIGSLVLSKLMNDWRLMDELAVLRAIYLLGSGDLLQHFLTVIFDKLDRGETWDDDFELNIILQESIRNSSDSMLISSPDSLVVSITSSSGSDAHDQTYTVPLTPTPRKSYSHSFGIDSLDSLKFSYKVSWPLELIANTEAIKKYNQVMCFLLKVKRAKFVLDKARRWMWKDKGNASTTRKRHWLVEQKLLHFVDAFHQYVMDRVYHSAWRELCEGMATAGSLDEVIEVHEAYLLSIQRQCFVVPDKLWALIANRINSILGLALDFYSIQQTLSSGGTVSAIRTRCEMEVDRIEKQFDDCIAFLLRVLSFKLNVGHFPHLADLVTRINYNYFYMSDTGNLRTAPTSESATSRLGKTFSG